MDFPSLLRSSVNLTFGRKRCSESVVVWLLLAFSFPACFLTVDFPSLLRSSVNLTFGRKRCSESVVVWLLLAFSFPACFLTVDFPSLLRSSVNLTFGRKRCSESVVALLLHLLLPCFYCPAHQVPWEDRKPYNKKKTHPQVCL